VRAGHEDSRDELAAEPRHLQVILSARIAPTAEEEHACGVAVGTKWSGEHATGRAAHPRAK
jgi:hypothetical protein